jgi:hypothetical protein
MDFARDRPGMRQKAVSLAGALSNEVPLVAPPKS